MTSRHEASWGSGGRGFKSPLPDQTTTPIPRVTPSLSLKAIVAVSRVLE